MTNILPVTLSGHDVRLEPLSLAHVGGLIAACIDGDLWQLNYTNIPEPTVEAMSNYVQEALTGQSRGAMLPFAVLDAQATILGSTRYYEIDTTTPTLAIGHTWYASRAQRTHVNTACKRLLLGHAFSALAMRTVYFHTSHLNLRSQAAIERLGAHKDGLLRQHKRHKDGGLRDTVCYSIIDQEWSSVRARLDARLEAQQA